MPRDDAPRRRFAARTDPPHWSHRLLTAEEELDLARRAKAGDRVARDELVLCNQRLVIRVARVHLREGLDLYDLVSAGNCGLLNATRKYDPETGVRFTTYATLWIMQAIAREVEKHSHTVRVPCWVQEILCSQTRDEALGDSGERSAERQAWVERRRQSECLEHARRALSSALGAVDGDRHSAVADHRDAIEAVDCRLDVEVLLQHATPDQARALRLIYGLDGEELSTCEIGRREGCSHQAVRIRHNRGLERIRAQIGA